MQVTPAEIIRALLIQGSGALFTDPTAKLAWPLFVDTMPDGPTDPNNCGCVYDTPGEVVTRLLASGATIEKYGIQIKTRAIDPTIGYRMLTQIADSLDTVKRQAIALTAGTFTIDTISRTSPVLRLGQDEKRRAMHTLNVMVMLLGH